ncbi:MAG: ATP-binding protein [Candidatus Nanopelagicales bacterium]
MGKGHLRVYLGAAPGVGKTYAMLGEGHRRLARGTDVVVGFVETHARPHTEELVAGLEAIPRAELRYRGSTFSEMDLDAILARRPAVVLVDELAHTNVPGSRNTKRWEDIRELLDAGIDVITTVNIQHLESLNDTVEAITGIKQQETVPDAVVRGADQIELEDMSPEALRRRLAHGNVYKADKVDAALGNYFRVGNLAALRELALLWLADRVDEALELYRNNHEISDTWAARQRVVVALTGGPEGETLLRRGAIVAGRSAGRDLVAVHVVRSDGARGTEADALVRQRTLTEELGGTFHTVVGDDVPSSLLEFTRSVNGTKIVVGESRRGRLSTALRPSAADLVVRESGDIDVQVVTHERAGSSLFTKPLQRTLSRRRRLIGVLLAVLTPALIGLVLAPIDTDYDLSLALLAMLVPVIGCTLVGGIVAAITASVTSTFLINWFFVEPLYSFDIAAPENFIALVLFILVGCTLAIVVDRSIALASEAAIRRAEAEALMDLSMGVLSRQKNSISGLLKQACESFSLQGAAIFERGDSHQQFRVIESVGDVRIASPERADVAVDAGGGLVLAASGGALTLSQRRILTVYAAQAVSLLERDRLVAKAADATRLRETENARRALLATISHDLRTPIAGIKAALSTLADEQLTLTDEDRRLLLVGAEQGANRLSSLVTNLLDMNRLQAGAVRPLEKPTLVEEVVQKAIGGLSESQVISEVGEDLPVIYTDPALLERILANIIENAARQRSDGIAVRVVAGEITEPIRRVDIRVVDRGPGVTADQQRAIFEPFLRSGDQKAAEAGGVGLGLAVAAGLASLIAAEIDVEDTPGGGLTMVVSVPVHRGAASAAQGMAGGDRS